MAEKDKTAETKLKHDGLFDFKELYKFIYTLLTDMQYEVEERSYSEKNSAGGKEIEVHWIGKRKVSDYFKFHIKVDYLILGLNSVEVTKDGVKAKTNKGSLEVKFSAYLEKDYDSKWESSPFLKFMRGIYDKYVIKQRIKDYENKAIADMVELSNQTKAFLALESKR